MVCRQLFHKGQEYHPWIYFPKKWITSLGLSYLRLYVNFVNPFVFTDYKGFDPEWAAAPINDATGGVASRTYQVGMNIKF
jgi:hypothetical protein